MLLLTPGELEARPLKPSKAYDRLQSRLSLTDSQDALFWLFYRHLLLSFIIIQSPGHKLLRISHYLAFSVVIKSCHSTAFMDWLAYTIYLKITLPLITFSRFGSRHYRDGASISQEAARNTLFYRLHHKNHLFSSLYASLVSIGRLIISFIDD